MPHENPLPSLTQFTTTSISNQGKSGRIADALTAASWLKEASTVKSVYIHVPFCFHKCHYCDFYSIAEADNYYEPFINQLSKELEFAGKYLNTVETIFVGGGTPTIFDEQLLGQMLNQISTHLSLSDSCEWTIEANPETISKGKASAMVKHGVNRVSIGAQTFNPDLLKRLERWHEPTSVERAVECVREAGIEDINLDLIYAIPSQTESQLIIDLEQAMSLEPTHLSCYSLVYEPNTPIRTRLDRGEVQRVEHEVEASMFQLVHEMLERKGYKQYEISNYAKTSFECQHNIAYWTNKSWWPFGPSASGHLHGRRWKNAPRISDYLSEGPLPPIVDIELLDSDRSAGEAFMVGLRMVKGMEKAWVDELIAKSNNGWRKDVIERNIQEGFLHWLDGFLAFTENGLHFADMVISELLMRDSSEQ